MTIPIPDLAASFGLVFARVGILVMLFPGIGERAVPARLRILFALLVTLILFPLVRPLLPAAGSPNGTLALFGAEIAVGLVLGMSVRILTASLQVAGSIIAQELGLSYAMTVDPTQGGQQEATIANFLALLGLTLVFATDLHHVAIRALRDSYGLLPPTGFPSPDDAARLAVSTIGQSFRVALQMSAPFVAFAMLFNLGTGILSRLMPQVQIFFLTMPLTILVGIGVLVVVLAAIMGVYIGTLGRFVADLGRP